MLWLHLHACFTKSGKTLMETKENMLCHRCHISDCLIGFRLNQLKVHCKNAAVLCKLDANSPKIPFMLRIFL